MAEFGMLVWKLEFDTTARGWQQFHSLNNCSGHLWKEPVVFHGINMKWWSSAYKPKLKLLQLLSVVVGQEDTKTSVNTRKMSKAGAALSDQSSLLLLQTLWN